MTSSAIVGAFILSCMTSSARAEINMYKIAQIESGGNPLAVNKQDGGRGLYQIMPILLKEYNNFHKVKYVSNDLFNVKINTEIARWYLTKRIPQMLRYYHKEVNIIICYNAGISYVAYNKRIPKITERYLKKYGV
jgi:soluble lytic murein transglycosylase-like protein